MPITTRSRAASCTRDDAAPEPAFPDPLPPAHTYHDEQAPSRDADTPAPPPDMTFSCQSVQAIIASLQQSQTDAFRDLLSVTRATTSSTPIPGEATLARCKAQFSGRPQESVGAFIDAVEAYADCAQVLGANILRGLSYLLAEEAAVWCHGVKDAVTSWAQAKDNLLNAYGDRRPPHRIYLTLFASPQREDENTDMFKARSRALLSKIPETEVSTKARLDMLYGLVKAEIRKRLRREEFDNFNELLRHARNIEDSQGEPDVSKPATASRDIRAHFRATANLVLGL